MPLLFRTELQHTAGEAQHWATPEAAPRSGSDRTTTDQPQGARHDHLHHPHRSGRSFRRHHRRRHRRVGAAGEPTGVWIDHTGRGAVEITNCGGSLCGRVVWLKDTARNETCGKQVIGNVKPVGGGQWDNGWIYDVDEDRRYDVEITPMGDRLKVMGYMGNKFLSETMTWRRAPADLKRCDA